jgi:glycerol-3-phosphate acyltransferase PlsY
MLNLLDTYLIAIALAYLIGSIPFGFLTAKFFRGIDIRQHGSMNIGATNVARVLGKSFGCLVLLLDCLKGLLPTLLLYELLDPFNAVLHPEPANLRVACGIAAIVGHMFPCWLKFRGGKGVATALGVAAVLSWQATLVAAVIFATVFAASRIVSLSSMLAAISYAAVHFWLTAEPFSAANWSQTAFSLAIPALIIVRHKTNIARLWRHEEAKFGSDAHGNDQSTT